MMSGASRVILSTSLTQPGSSLKRRANSLALAISPVSMTFCQWNALPRVRIKGRSNEDVTFSDTRVDGGRPSLVGRGAEFLVSWKSF